MRQTLRYYMMLSAVAAGLCLGTGCSKTVIDPSRYQGGASGSGSVSASGATQGYEASGQGETAAYGQTSMPIVEESLLESPPASTASAAPASSSAYDAAPAASGVAAAPGVYDEAPAASTAAVVPAPVEPAAPVKRAPSGPRAPSAEEELAAVRAAERAAPSADAALDSTLHPAPAAGSGAGAQQAVAVYQLQSFLDSARALSYREQLAAKGYDVFFEEANVDGRPFTRVLVRIRGDAATQQATLDALGVSGATRRHDMEKSSLSHSSAASPARTATQIPPAPAVASPAASYEGAATLPVVSPPAETVAKPAAAPAAACRVTPLYIEARGKGLPGFGSPIMVEKQAREDARRNLLLCVDAYRKEQGLVPQDYTLSATIPPGLMEVGDVELDADGGVSASMRIRLTDLPKLDVQVLQ